jgi:hypothetical protein
MVLVLTIGTRRHANAAHAERADRQREGAIRFDRTKRVGEEHEIRPASLRQIGRAERAGLGRHRHRHLHAGRLVDEDRLRLAFKEQACLVGIDDEVAEVEHVAGSRELEALDANPPAPRDGAGIARRERAGCRLRLGRPDGSAQHFRQDGTDHDPPRHRPDR